jgi:hypothetical protein
VFIAIRPAAAVASEITAAAARRQPARMSDSSAWASGLCTARTRAAARATPRPGGLQVFTGEHAGKIEADVLEFVGERVAEGVERGGGDRHGGWIPWVA